MVKRVPFVVRLQRRRDELAEEGRDRENSGVIGGVGSRDKKSLDRSRSTTTYKKGREEVIERICNGDGESVRRKEALEN